MRDIFCYALDIVASFARTHISIDAAARIRQPPISSAAALIISGLRRISRAGDITCLVVGAAAMKAFCREACACRARLSRWPATRGQRSPYRATEKHAARDTISQQAAVTISVTTMTPDDDADYRGLSRTKK